MTCETDQNALLTYVIATIKLVCVCNNFYFTGLFYVPVKYYRALPVITHLPSYHKYLYHLEGGNNFFNITSLYRIGLIHYLFYHCCSAIRTTLLI
jgi:hypothetical protein